MNCLCEQSQTPDIRGGTKRKRPEEDSSGEDCCRPKKLLRRQSDNDVSHATDIEAQVVFDATIPAVVMTVEALSADIIMPAAAGIWHRYGVEEDRSTRLDKTSVIVPMRVDVADCGLELVKSTGDAVPILGNLPTSDVKSPIVSYNR